MKNWDSNIENYKLSDEYLIERANPREFAIYESIYGDKKYNRFAVKDWDLRLAISADNPFAKEDSFYWIKLGEKRIGGVLIEPNVISRLFIIPPFTDTFEVIKLLKKLLMNWSDRTKAVYAYQITPEQSEYFQMLGFWPDKNRRWMIRPTETFDYTWDDSIIIKTPDESKISELVTLFYESFSSDIDVHYNGQENNIENYLCEVNEYFDEKPNDILIEASTLLYDKHNEKLIGACLVSLCEQWPLIYYIAVHPEYRGKHMATAMLKKALTVLNKEYPVLRLFVTLGNASESIYYGLGFVPGVEFKKLYIPALERNCK